MFKNILYFLCSSLLEKERLKAFNEGVKSENDRLAKQRMVCEQIELEKWIGKIIVVFTNEWEDPILAKGVEITYMTMAMCPVLVYEDLLTGKKAFGGFCIFEYDEEFFRLALALNPEQRYKFLSRNAKAKMDSPHQLTDKKTIRLKTFKDYEPYLQV